MLGAIPPWLQRYRFAPQWLPRPLRGQRAGITIAVIAGIIATAIGRTAQLRDPSFPYPGTTFTCVVMAAAIIWGLAPALITLVIGTVVLSPLVMHSGLFGLQVGPELTQGGVVGTLLGLVIGTGMSLVASLAVERHLQVVAAREESEALAAVGATLASALDPGTVYQTILAQAARVLPFDHAIIALYLDGWVVSVAALGGPEIVPNTRLVPIDPSTSFWQVLKSGKPVYLANTAEIPDWADPDPWRGPNHVRCAIVIPLLIDGALIGSFQVNSYVAHFYSARQVRMAAAFGERAAQAVRNARLFESEQARVRAAEHLAGLQRDFVSAASHELRTPLTAIIGFGELLQAHWPQMSDKRRLERIDQMVQAANRQKRLVEDLLLTGRLEGSNLVPRRELLPLAGLVQQAVDEVQASYRGQTVLQVGPMDLHVTADAALIVQVLTNLLDNAAKYSPEGSPITIRWEQEERMVLLRVIDHGSGVPEDGHELLFTRFGRLPGSAIRGGRVGTGLGLYISRGLAEAMGGSLDLEATGPDGSTFRLSLPGGVAGSGSDGT